MDTSRVRKEIARQTPTPAHLKIEDLRVGMKKVNVVAEVLETAKPSKVHTQFRDNALVSNATIGDETGKILLCLWDQQVDAVSTGECIEVANAHVASFKGERQLRLGKNGKITKLESLTSKTANKPLSIFLICLLSSRKAQHKPASLGLGISRALPHLTP